MQFARKSRAFNSCRLGSTLCKTLPTCAVHDLAVHAGTGDLVAGKGVVKVRCKNRYEVQIDTETAKSLQVAGRRPSAAPIGSRAFMTGPTSPIS